MSSEQPIKPRTRLMACAELWSKATGRSLGALSSVVTNNGGSLARLDDPGNAVTDATLEKFARFLLDPANWPDGDVPQEVRAFGHVTGVSIGEPAVSAGQSGPGSTTDLSGVAA